MCFFILVKILGLLDLFGFEVVFIIKKICFVDVVVCCNIDVV